jgi:chaperone BCS1
MTDEILKALGASPIFTGALLASALGAAAYKAKDALSQLLEKVRSYFVFTARVYQYDELFYAMEDWCGRHHGQSYRDVEAGLSPRNDWADYDAYKAARAAGNRREVFTIQEENIFTVKRGGKRILVRREKEKTESRTPPGPSGGSAKDRFFCKYVIYGWFARKEVLAMLQEIADEYDAAMKKTSVRVYSNSGWGEWTRLGNIEPKEEGALCLPREVRQATIEDAKRFTQSKEFYAARNIPYKRGYCLHGPPGTGKTSLSLALAASVHRSVFILNMNSLGDDASLIRCFSAMDQNGVLLIEDIDKIFAGREAQKGVDVSFSALLNCLDGGLFREGLITIITTNHPESLDPALLRAGRTDVSVNVELATPQLVSEYMTRFYGRRVTFSKDARHAMAAVQEACIQHRDDPDAALAELSRQTQAAGV